MRRDQGLLLILVVGLLGTVFLRIATNSDISLAPAVVAVLLVAGIIVVSQRKAGGAYSEGEDLYDSDDAGDDFVDEFGIRTLDNFEPFEPASYSGPSGWDDRESTPASYESEVEYGFDSEGDQSDAGLSSWTSTGDGSGDDEMPGLGWDAGDTPSSEFPTWETSSYDTPSSEDSYNRGDLAEPYTETEPYAETVSGISADSSDPDAYGSTESEWSEPETTQWAEPDSDGLPTWESGGDLPTWQSESPTLVGSGFSTDNYGSDPTWDSGGSVSSDGQDYEPLPIWNTFAAEEVIEDVQSDEDILAASQSSALHVTEDLSEEEVQRVNQELLSRVHSLLAKYD